MNFLCVRVKMCLHQNVAFGLKKFLFKIVRKINKQTTVCNEFTKPCWFYVTGTACVTLAKNITTKSRKPWNAETRKGDEPENARINKYVQFPNTTAPHTHARRVSDQIVSFNTYRPCNGGR